MEFKEKDYASKAAANTGIALGAVGTGLGLLNGAGNLFGRGCGNYGSYGAGCGTGYGHCGGNYGGCGYGCGCGWYNGCGYYHLDNQIHCADRKESEDVLRLTAQTYGLELGTERELHCMDVRLTNEICHNALCFEKELHGMDVRIERELHAMDNKNCKTAFELYKTDRDGFDILNNKICKLEAQAAAAAAVAPYQNALIKAEIEKSHMLSDFELFKRTCKMMTGEVVLPVTPTVTGIASIQNCQGCGTHAVSVAA